MDVGLWALRGGYMDHGAIDLESDKIYVPTGDMLGNET